ncbi:MAG: YqiJ family protein [Myxococcales bacterium]|nr:YqiJ family protein [Myxococcales bacterium]
MFTAFVAAALAYPTVLWTVALGFVLLYWLLVAGGSLDVEALGGADGVGDAAGTPADAGLGAAAGLFNFLGLRHVPLTVYGTAVALFNFVACHFTLALTGPVALLPGAIIAFGLLVVSLPLCGVLVRPLRPLFKVHEAPRRAHLVGKLGEVATGRVDARFGQARVDDGGAGLIVEIRSTPATALARGERVVLVAWDVKREAFEVERFDDVLPARDSPAPQGGEPPNT